MKSTLSPIGARSRAGFTLIELLVVIAIIAILVGLLISIAGYVQERGANVRAQTEISSISGALNNYKMDNGTYPEGDGKDTSTRQLLDAIYPKDTSMRVYLALESRMLDGSKSNKSADAIRNSAKYIVDPWGSNYRYFFKRSDADNADGSVVNNPETGSQNNGPLEFDLWSYGKKGADANKEKPEKWIKNW